MNLPSLLPGEPEPGIVHCPLEIVPLPLNFRAGEDHLHYDGNYHERRRRPGATLMFASRGRSR